MTDPKFCMFFLVIISNHSWNKTFCNQNQTLDSASSPKQQQVPMTSSFSVPLWKWEILRNLYIFLWMGAYNGKIKFYNNVMHIQILFINNEIVKNGNCLDYKFFLTYSLQLLFFLYVHISIYLNKEYWLFWTKADQRSYLILILYILCHIHLSTKYVSLLLLCSRILL